LSGCSSSTSSQPAANASATCPVTVSDAWVKAADTGMTAAFGTVTNTSDDSVTITAASSPASTAMELHEVVDSNGKMAMQPKPDGFTVPANGTLTLEPGGYHLMLMDVTQPIKAGDSDTFTLTCADGGSAEFTTQAKDYSGGDEKYQKEGMDSMDSRLSKTPSGSPS